MPDAGGVLNWPNCMRRNPKQIAEEIAAQLPPDRGSGWLRDRGRFPQFRLDRGYYARGLMGEQSAAAREAAGAKIIVEHTNINPNKAAHIGHLRNAILGDTFVRMLRSAGGRVEVQNYIDNTGVQVADVVAGFHFLEKQDARAGTGSS